jgi:lysophospholipase L1-like esterase
MTKNRWIIAVTLLQFVLAQDSLRADEETTIMAVGDSITQGGKSFRCYREFLVPLLSKSVPQVRFVGPNQDSASAHCGYGGRDARFLSIIIKDVYTKYQPDIVLIHAGHNCFSKDKPVPGIISATEQLIDTIHSLNPDVTVLLAQVIPSGKLPKYSYIPELNAELKKTAEQMKAKGMRVILVDQANGFDWMSDTVGDKVHPSESGARKMADRWMKALKPIFTERQKAGR